MTAPTKEVIYVDTEDDITAVIQKVKAVKAPIVALVPPKRIGMLQSIVNLKLVNRAAESANKRLVIITNDSALGALAAGVAIPVAKNLQTKPEVAEITALNIDDEEVIDGEALPVGEHAGLAATSTIEPAVPVAAAVATAGTGSIAAEKAATKAPLKKDAKRSKIPDFNAFKKRILLISGGLLALLIFLVWAVWFAPHATVTIAAKTTPYNVSQQVTARANASLNPNSGILPAQIASKKQSKTVDFTATGKKNVGKKASGEIKLSKLSPSSTTIPAGSKLTSESGLVFITDSSAVIPASQPCFPNFCAQSVNVGVTAEKQGANYNGATGDLGSVPQGASAEFTDATSGGTDKTVTVVSDADVAKAREELAGVDEGELKAELKKEFDGKDVIVIDESFRVNVADPSVSPAVGEEANQATLKSQITYQLVAVDKSDVEKIIDNNVKEQLDREFPEDASGQRIYKHGTDEVRISQLNIEEGNYKFVIETTAYVGPQIDEKELAGQLTNKLEGEIQEVVKTKTQDSVRSVDVDFSPFWVNKVGSDDKITIKFDIENAE